MPLLQATGVSHQIQAPTTEFDDIGRGAKRFMIVPAKLGVADGDELIISEVDPGSHTLTGRTQRAIVTYVISEANPCALSPQALNPDYAAVSIAVQE